MEVGIFWNKNNVEPFHDRELEHLFRMSTNCYKSQEHNQLINFREKMKGISKCMPIIMSVP